MAATTKPAGRTRRRTLAVVATRSATGLAVLMLFTAACMTAEAPPNITSGGEAGPVSTTTPTTKPPPETRPPEDTVSTTEPTTTTEAPAPAPATTDPAPMTVPLPGEASDFGPAEGAVLAVVGVDHDDVLNVRDVPAGEIIATLGLLKPVYRLSRGPGSALRRDTGLSGLVDGRDRGHRQDQSAAHHHLARATCSRLDGLVERRIPGSARRHRRRDSPDHRNPGR